MQEHPSHVSLGRRFALIAGLVAAALVLSVIGAAVSLFRARATVAQVAGRDMVQAQAAERLLGTFYRMQIAERGYLTYVQERYLDALQKAEAELARDLALLLHASEEASDVARLREVARLFGAYRELFAQRRAILSGQVVPRGRGEFQALAAREEGLLDQMEALLQRVVSDRVQASVLGTQQMFRQTLIMAALVLAAMAAALIGLLVIYLTGRRVVDRVVRLSRQISLFRGASDRLATVQVDGRDEVGHLAVVFNELQREIYGRARDLSASLVAVARANQAKSVLLANIHDGLLTLDERGRIAEERSAIVDEWLGAPAPGQPFWAYIAAADPGASEMFALSWQMLIEDVMPRELVLAQMPQRLRAGERVLHVGYKPLGQDGALGQVMLILSDITAEVERERLEAEHRDLLNTVHCLLKNREAFRDFYHDADGLVRKLVGVEQRSLVETRRMVHTLKGNSSIFGLTTLASFCHDVESQMEERAAGMTEEERRELSFRWAQLSEKFAKLLGQGGDGVTLNLEEYEAHLRGLREGRPRGELLEEVLAWRLQPTLERLMHLGDQARDLGRRLGKGEIEVGIEWNNLRVRKEPWIPFFSALVHVVRNAVDHGLEAEEERRAAGKQGPPRIGLRTALRDGTFVVEVSDNGRGVRWERLRDRARARGLPAETRAELVEALFADGVSTREQVSEVSGRGVGMGAVRQACRDLGGEVRVQSEAGHGTTFSFLFPLTELALRLGPLPLSAPGAAGGAAGMSEAQWDVVGPLCAAACEELFLAYGVALLRTERGAAGGAAAMCAMVGLISDVLHGHARLRAAPEVLAQLGDAGVEAEAEAEGWIVELANQFLGRLKNKLLPYGVSLYPSTPVFQRSGEGAQGGGRVVWFLAESGPVGLEFNAVMDPSYVFPAFPLLVEAPLAEGEMILF